jgi:hypothetical protein
MRTRIAPKRSTVIPAYHFYRCGYSIYWHEYRLNCVKSAVKGKTNTEVRTTFSYSLYARLEDNIALIFVTGSVYPEQKIYLDKCRIKIKHYLSDTL